MAATSAPARARRAPASAPAGAPRRPPLRVVRPERRGPSRSRLRPPVALALGSVLASLLAVGAAHAYLTAGQVKLAHIQQELAGAQATERSLQVQVAQLEDPSHVVARAQQQGLTVPTQVTDLPLVGGVSTNTAPAR